MINLNSNRDCIDGKNISSSYIKLPDILIPKEKPIKKQSLFHKIINKLFK